jgi:hypothetical protein
MKATLESTARFVRVDGVRCRVWVGATESGAPFRAFILGVRPTMANVDEFERALVETQLQELEEG